VPRFITWFPRVVMSARNLRSPEENVLKYRGIFSKSKGEFDQEKNNKCNEQLHT